MVVGINCGHTVSGTIGCGAVGAINESDATRAVGYKLMKLFREAGHKVVDCTNDYASSVSDNLRQICSIANSVKLDMFLSIHFNAGGGRGVEAYTIGAKNTANAKTIVKNIESLGFKNRGIKDGSHLYVVKHTYSPAVLIEVCFVDSEDANAYKKIGADAVAKAIYRAITNDTAKDEGELSMTQYEELKNQIEDISNAVNKLSNPMIYNYIDSNMPEWARPTVQKLVDKGFLKGNEGGLNLTDDLLRLLVINDRAGLYD